MKNLSNLHNLIAGTVLLLSCTLTISAQEFSKKYAHIRFPEEIDIACPNSHNAFASGSRSIWRINTHDWTFEKVIDLSNKGFFKQVQGLATVGDDVYWYVNGEGIYHMLWNGNSATLVRPRSEDFLKNYEEAYKSMNIDATGRYLLLYGKNENVAVFDRMNGLKPTVVFNDFVEDAYWVGNKLYAGCVDNKVVINTRSGKSKNNQDFINTGDNDQRGLTKIYVSKDNILPNMGEVEKNLGESGELERFIYNKANGDLLMCISSFGSDGPTKIYKIDNTTPILVAQMKDWCSDFAAYGNKIFARTIRGFVEVPYGTDLSTELTPFKIKTDILKPKLWNGHKPDPYEISNAYYMDYDKDGNLWIVEGKDLFVVFKNDNK